MMERDKKTVYLRRPATAQNEYLDTVISWGEAVPIRAAHQSAGGLLEAQVYGERLRNMRTLYYDGTETIRVADGFCLFVGPEEGPDYRAAGEPQVWRGHMAVPLEFIPPEKRRNP